MLPLSPIRAVRNLGRYLRTLDEVEWRPPPAAILFLLMILPTTVAAVRSLAHEEVVLELGWEGVVRQSVPNSCGPAVIATLLLWRGKEFSDLEVAAEANLQPRGMSLAEFARMAAEYGFPGHWFSVAKGGRSRRFLPLPVVVHLNSPEGHFAVLEREFEGYVQLADPARGRVLLPIEQFESEWTGRSFLFDPGVDLPTPES